MLNLGAEMGYLLMINGAEIYRVEDSIGRLLRAYGLDSGEVFAIPNCLIVSVLGHDGEPMTRIRRIPPHGTNIEQLERYNDLCRALCRETPEYEDAMTRLVQVEAARRSYPPLVRTVGYFIGAFGFCLFFQGTVLDALMSGLCGVSIGACMHFMGRLGSNTFFKTMAASMVSAFLAFAFAALSQGLNADLITIGALMSLVPGVAFTSALRDTMAGDMVSGISKTTEGILIGVAVAIGTGAALTLSRAMWGG